jgi:hypothetical protein
MGNLGDMIQAIAATGSRSPMRWWWARSAATRSRSSCSRTDEADFFKRDLDRIRRTCTAGSRSAATARGIPTCATCRRSTSARAAALRNPTIRPALQIRHALEDARGHIDLVARLESR